MRGLLVVACSLPFRHVIRFFSVSHCSSEWRIPTGFDTGIKIFNSQTRSKVPLILPRKNHLYWYMCGPTVYDDAHIGHGSCYMKFDIIRRILDKFFDINVIQLMGITDIDDKIIARSKNKGTTPELLAKKYELDFVKDLHDLGITAPHLFLRVSQVIPLVIDFVETIVAKGFGYVAIDGTVYFDVAKYGRNYGKLLHHVPENDPQLDKSDKFKRSVADFALWKASKPGEPFWESPWGTGRPGWHIECSTMASYFFGDKLDVHSGGIDLLFPHHENELAQSCVHHDTTQWVNYWLHSGHLNLKSVKMSKSLNNFVSIRQFLSENSANEFRLFCLQSHYRNSIEYNEDVLVESKSLIGRLRTFVTLSESYVRGDTLTADLSEAELFESLERCRESVRNALANDFDTRKAITEIVNLVSRCSRQLQALPTDESRIRCPAAIAAVQSYVETSLKDLGVTIRQDENNARAVRSEKPLNVILDSAVKFRRTVRSLALDKESGISGTSKASLLSASDNFRQELGSAGIRVEDRTQTSTWTNVED